MLIADDTTCPVCGLRVAGQVLYVSKWFTANRADPMWPYAERALHEECADRVGLQNAVAEKVSVLTRRGLPRLCPTCHQPIQLASFDRPYFALGRVSSGRAGPLVEFDHLFFHADHLESWPRWAELKQRIEEARLRGEWDGPLPILEPYAHWPGHAVIDPTKIESVDDPD